MVPVLMTWPARNATARSAASAMAALLTCLLTAMASSASAQSRVTALNAYFTALAQAGEFNGVVLVADHGKVVYQQAFGYADLHTKRPNVVTAPFPIASITKTITSTAVLQLREQGRLSLTDPVTKYFPTFPYPAITIRHLLSHTSGLEPYDSVFASARITHPDEVFTNHDYIGRLVAERRPLRYAPGTQWNYDNVNFLVLALIVEKASGTSFVHYVTRHILQPSGMTHTRWSPVYSGADDPTVAVPYQPRHLFSDSLDRADSIPWLAAYWHTYRFNGFGELLSTAEDLLRFDEALYDGRLLNANSLHDAFTPVKLTSGADNPTRYGLGWTMQRQDSSLGSFVMHPGGQFGLNTVLLRNIAKHQTVIAFDNTNGNVVEPAFNAMKLLQGRTDVPRPRTSAAKTFRRTVEAEGPVAAEQQLNANQRDTLQFYVDETEFNALGYDLLENQPTSLALAVFRVTTLMFPDSWNAFDSYGEALARSGNKQDAIAMYRRSITLNPNNEGGKKALADLLR